MDKGKTIRLYLEEGLADGIRTVELSISTVLGTIVPRPKVTKYLHREEWQRPGVYILYGANEADEPMIYIGEGDPVANRIKQHSFRKDFWDECIVFTSKDMYITKTQIQFLESRLLVLAEAAGRYHLDNKDFSSQPNISRADQSEVAQFLNHIIVLLEALGYDFLNPITLAEELEQTSELEFGDADDIVYEYNPKTAQARMKIINNKYVLLKGSTIVRDISKRKSTRLSTRELRKEYQKRGLLAEKGDVLEITQGINFDAPSAAAVFVNGGSVNGRISWQHEGKTLRDIEREKLSNNIADNLE